jgi:hypothetical protein
VTAPATLLTDVLTVVPEGKDKVHSATSLERRTELRPDAYDGMTTEAFAAALAVYQGDTTPLTLRQPTGRGATPAVSAGPMCCRPPLKGPAPGSLGVSRRCPAGPLRRYDAGQQPCRVISGVIRPAATARG